jgi:plasmid stability protein
MPTTLTLKNIPDLVYDQLKLAAKANRRSLNSEAIMLLESALIPTRLTANERLVRAQALRESLPAGQFSAAEIDLAKREGRP